MPPRVAAEVAGGILAAMPGSVPAIGALGAKLVTVFPANADRPTHQAVVVLFDPATGTPTALLDGTLITSARTAAASRGRDPSSRAPDSEVMALLGTGVQARAHALTVPRVCPALREIRVTGRDRDGAEVFARTLANERDLADLSITAVATFADAVAAADVVCATTHSPDPVVRRADAERGHARELGRVQHGGTRGRRADRARRAGGRRVARGRPSRRFRPERTNCSGRSATGSWTRHTCTPSWVSSSRARNRVAVHADQITLYKSVGVAVEDLAAAMLVLEAAQAQNVGTSVDV